MSKEKLQEFKKECIGYIESDIFPNMCAHFSLSKDCNFFIDSETNKKIICDDLKEKS